MHHPSSAHYSPLLDIGLCNFSPSRSIFSYSHPAPACRPAQIVTPPDLRASYANRDAVSTFRTCLPQRLSILRLILPAHFYLSVLIRCAMSVTWVFCRIVSISIYPIPYAFVYIYQKLWIVISLFYVRSTARLPKHMQLDISSNAFEIRAAQGPKSDWCAVNVLRNCG
jgi:hypothetical protein